MRMELQEIRREVLKIVAGIPRVATRDLQVREKSHLDIVTSADFELQHYFRECFGKSFPGVGFADEEDWNESTLIQNECWVVDPLDGTANFASGLCPYGISVALAIAGEAKIAVVKDLCSGELFHAVEGDGARLQDEVLRCDSSGVVNLLGTSTGTVDYLLNTSIELRALRKVFKLRILGSQALQLCYVAAGKLAANLSVEAKLWDDIAGALIIREAGGIYDAAGQNINQGGDCYSLAASPDMFNVVKDCLGDSWPTPLQ